MDDKLKLDWDEIVEWFQLHRNHRSMNNVRSDVILYAANRIAELEQFIEKQTKQWLEQQRKIAEIEEELAAHERAAVATTSHLMHGTKIPAKASCAMTIAAEHVTEKIAELEEECINAKNEMLKQAKCITELSEEIQELEDFNDTLRNENYIFGQVINKSELAFKKLKEENQALREAAELRVHGWLFQHEETGQQTIVDDWQVRQGFEQSNPRLQKICRVYTLPPEQGD